MRIQKLLFPIVAALAAIASLRAAEKVDLKRIDPVPDGTQIPIQDFFRPRRMIEPRLNTAGTHIAALVSNDEDKYMLLVYNLSSKKMEVIKDFGDRDIVFVKWLDDAHVLFGLTAEKLYGTAWVVGKVGTLNAPNPVLQYSIPRLVGIPRDDPMHPIAWIRSDLNADGNYTDAGVVSVDTRRTSPIPLKNLLRADASWNDLQDVVKENAEHKAAIIDNPRGGTPIGYMSDKDGHLAYGFTVDDGGYWHLHELDGDKWADSPADFDKFDIVGTGNSPHELLIVKHETGDKPNPLQFLNAQTGDFGDVLVQEADYDFDGYVYYDPVSGVPIGAAYEKQGPTMTWFSEDYQHLQKKLNEMFPGMVVRIIDSDLNANLFLVKAFSDRQPPIYYSVDMAKHAVSLVQNSAPWIPAKRMCTMNILKYKTRDGHKLDAYFTLPKGASKQNPAPLVVLPHGGPFVRDTWNFNEEAQFLASRGYAVLQPNYRGSTGYDWMFTVDEHWDFEAMSNDVTDATRLVLRSGYVDPKRVAIMGASFGGYLALSGVTREPDLYRCAITNVGVFDWAEMVNDSKDERFDSARYASLLRHLGNPAKAAAKFAEISPINFVNKIKVPVFVAHGKDDSNVSVNQSRRLIAALEKYNVPYEKLLVRGEGHGMAHLENQVEYYAKVEAFLRKNLGPTPENP